MAYMRWKDLKHPGTPQQREERKKEALAELDRMGYAALRKARSLTQVELAERLNLSQGNVAALEARTDLHISTLSKYIRAMGGELEMRAVFPEATFHLEAPPPTQAKPPKHTEVRAATKPVRAAAPRIKRVAEAAG